MISRDSVLWAITLCLWCGLSVYCIGCGRRGSAYLFVTFYGSGVMFSMGTTPSVIHGGVALTSASPVVAQAIRGENEQKDLL
jgi:hypothetical protein